ncbi:MurR/RpiR family transcriptional regulator [Companilactobacillus kimchii]|uniref:RpiR family transcriptional regulator n=2 Tax=Companilactobacillus kimchii TaxID=2801452 RepID=A0ABR5NSR5_9LACO|nr:MurR/RpiR family transcriptional regulator [Companilactobacillus kimchii]KAE9562208.1 hypothetical protein ATN91_06365 [Companilactobacillus kimchii]KRK51170.1 RpiR family transcriptional regulator [Companilactobacillus kimchii DSM 13961 = JCM 10707]OWF34348.1 hypothetical protein LKACC12383_00261 [Companilactobacillus kimchii]GEO46270.1 RpiR family transcriptional regulator [Companilactobacillus paralimentarius]
MAVNNFDQRIVNLTHPLTENEKNVIEYIHQHQSEINGLTISELAKKIHYSSSFISKLVKKIGYTDFAELRYDLKSSIEEKADSPQYRVINQQKIDISKTNSMLIQTSFDSINHLLKNSTAIYVYGTGHSQANYMRELSRNLMLLVNVPVIFLSGRSEFESVQPVIKSTDCIWIASISGESRNVIEGTKLLCLNQVPIISMTPFSDNTLASLATYNLFYYSTPIPNPIRNRDVVSYLSLGYCIDYVIREYIDFLQKLK